MSEKAIINRMLGLGVLRIPWRGLGARRYLVLSRSAVRPSCKKLSN